MQLADWIKGSDLRVVEIASKLGITRVSLYRLMRRDAQPSLDLACKIEAMTNGAVRAVDLNAVWLP